MKITILTLLMLFHLGKKGNGRYLLIEVDDNVISSNKGELRQNFFQHLERMGFYFIYVRRDRFIIVSY